MEKMREEFEWSFIKSSGIGCLELCDMVDARVDDGYVDSEIDIQFAMNIGWIMWKSSRESQIAVCISEIMPNRYETDEYFDGWVNCKAAVEDALDKAGVSYK